MILTILHLRRMILQVRDHHLDLLKTSHSEDGGERTPEKIGKASYLLESCRVLYAILAMFRDQKHMASWKMFSFILVHFPESHIEFHGLLKGACEVGKICFKYHLLGGRKK